MYAIKEAVIAKEHHHEVEPTIFYMDVRAYGKGFDAYYERAKSEYGVRFIKCMVSRVREHFKTKNLLVTYLDEEGKIVEEEFDLVVLSVGMAIDANVLIFERLKEEMRDGKPLMVAVEEGFKRVWPSIRDSNASTLITLYHTLLVRQ
jgi:heterodisulfide reductase subunit A-like polyferredoxin